MSKHRDVKGTFKTESNGVKEYNPSKTFVPGANLTNEQKEAWDKDYRQTLINRILQHQAKDGLKFKDSFGGLILFNEDLNNPAWTWNTSNFDSFGTWQLRDLALLLERLVENKKK